MKFVKKIWNKIWFGVKNYQADIILLIGVILISLISFALGYIVAKIYDQEPLQFEIMKNKNYEGSHNWGRHLGIISGLEIG